MGSKEIDTTELVFIEKHQDFGSAAQRAKDLANNFSETIGVERCDVGWAVVASQKIQSLLATNESVSDDSDDPNSDFQTEDLDEDLLFEEIQSDQDAFARSEEEGWFYED